MTLSKAESPLSTPGKIAERLTGAAKGWESGDLYDKHFLAAVRQAIADLHTAERPTGAMPLLDELRRLHSQFTIYGECDHKHDGLDGADVVVIDDIGYTCKKEYEICRACCCNSEGEQLERCMMDHHHGPGVPICKTAELLSRANDAFRVTEEHIAQMMVDLYGSEHDEALVEDACLSLRDQGVSVVRRHSEG